MIADRLAAPWVVVPTYDEAASIGRLVARLLTAMRSHSDGRFAVLIVDDGSPDGTGEIAEDLAAAHPEIRVLHRNAKDGLGAAYRAGFALALAGGATRVVQMDADLSHDPAAVPELLEASERADLVLGSRYVPGGSTPDWPARRRLVSRAGCLYARALLGVAVRDLTGGFKCWRPALLARVLAGGVGSQGYAFQIEMTLRASEQGAAIAEVPIVFRDRDAGASKLSGGIIGEAVLRVPALRWGAADLVAPAPASGLLHAPLQGAAGRSTAGAAP